MNAAYLKKYEFNINSSQVNKIIKFLDSSICLVAFIKLGGCRFKTGIKTTIFIFYFSLFKFCGHL